MSDEKTTNILIRVLAEEALAYMSLPYQEQLAKGYTITRGDVMPQECLEEAAKTMAEELDMCFDPVTPDRQPWWCMAWFRIAAKLQDDDGEVRLTNELAKYQGYLDRETRVVRTSPPMPLSGDTVLHSAYLFYRGYAKPLQAEVARTNESESDFVHPDIREWWNESADSRAELKATIEELLADGVS